ncbi:hypothetical protein BT93_G0701 [Corymbia citriodora subsp. variegata]|nr:hypothetical protein BT93_G0701 [Corymbia citriodora subsp. variegata]
MANLETGASTSNTSRSEHQVFLSFRELDTSCTFTNFLHQALVEAGIRVFINDEGLRPSERISDTVLQAIDNSKFYIPIFSKDYASSHWCLDELAKMVENKGKVILPIFYDVKPDDVELKTALYKDAISNLGQIMEDQKNKFSPKDIETWRQALREVGRIKGWELEKYPGYAKLIQVVVHEVVVWPKTRQRHVTEDLVGMEDPIADINNLLAIDSSDVRLIGIYGMGGIGKTTLALIIFNQLCPRFGRYSSFLDNVGEIAKTKDDTIPKLKSPEIKGSVQALCLKRRSTSKHPTFITSEQMKRFPHIRFLSLCEVNCEGDFWGCLSELKWISLDYGYIIPPRPTTDRDQPFEVTNSLHLENVVVVNLSGVDITKDVFASLIKGARKLKVLTLCYNTSMHGTPTFPRDSGLEKLTISNFLSLKKIDHSIGKLGKLIALNFELCVELEKLPEQIGELQELQHLSLRSCDSLRELPNSVLKLTSLKKLDVWGTRITRLPDSIDRLSSLSSINASFTSIEKLPSTMSKLLCLQALYLNNFNGIRELPELPESLTTLRLTSNSLVTVPNLSYLTNLVELALSDGSEYVAESDIIQTCDLQWIGSLSGLSKLQLCFSNVCVSTIELGSLSLLKELTLHGVDVPTFEQLPSAKLKVLELYDTRGKKIQLPPSEKETAIDASSSRESEESKVLRQIEFIFDEDHELSDGSSCLREEPGCNELQAPELIDHWRGDFRFPSSMNTLQKLVLWGCPGVQDIEFVPAQLFLLSVGGCTSLKRLGSLSNLKFLRELTLNRCWSLQVVEGIDKLEFLHQLKIDRCGSVERIIDPSSSKIPNKCSIEITHCGNLPDTGPTSNTWESYREKILNGTEIETTDSETETRDTETGEAIGMSFHIIPQGNLIFGFEQSETETGDAAFHFSSMVTVADEERTDSETETETEVRMRLLSIPRLLLFLLLYLLSISALLKFPISLGISICCVERWQKLPAQP